MKKHFTFYELVVVIAMTMVMLTVLHAAYGNVRKGPAKLTLCMEQICTLTQGEQLYANEHDGNRTPVVNNEPERCGYLKSARQLALLYRLEYVKDPHTFYCPSVNMPDNPNQLRDPDQWATVKEKDTIISYWSANWYEKEKAWDYKTFKLSGPFPTFTGWHASGRTPGSPSEMPLVMDIGGIWKNINPDGLHDGNKINVSFADGSAMTYVDVDGRIAKGDWHNIWLAPDAIMLYRSR